MRREWLANMAQMTAQLLECTKPEDDNVHPIP